MKGQSLTPICPHCGQFSHQVTGEVIYPHRPDLYHKIFYQCKPCDAYVGTHATTDKPLGSLANSKLRQLRNAAHAAFDPLWKGGKLERGYAYSMLAQGLNIPKAECHIAMFDATQCQRVIDLCNSRGIYKYATDKPPQSEGKTGVKDTTD